MKNQPASKTAYDRFLDTRSDYLARERAASEQAEKVHITGAAGALALSVAFLEKIAPDPTPASRILLGLGWLVLLISLAAGLLTFMVRSQGYQMAREALDAAAAKGTAHDPREFEQLNDRLVPLAHIRLWSLLVGVVLLVVFAFLNVPVGAPK